MFYQAISLVFLIGAIVLGFMRKINVGIVAFGLAFILGLIGKVSTGVILGGFPSRLFVTLLGTMFFFCLLQENQTLELLSKKMVAMVGKRAFLIPIIVYLVSYLLSAAGPGAIAVQSVMIVFAVALSVQMQASPILLGAMAILGAVGGTASPIALTGIIVTDLTANMDIGNIANNVFLGISVSNLLCAILLYFAFGGYKLKPGEEMENVALPKFNKKQIICIVALVVLVVLVVGLRYDVGLVSFSLALLLILFGVVDEKASMKLIPWSVLILICGVSVLMAVTKEMGGIKLLSDGLAALMSPRTAAPIMGLTGGIMSWFSSANGVVFPTLIPTTPDIVATVGGGVSATELIMAIVGAATVAGISPLSVGGSLTLAAYVQETKADGAAQQKVFGKLFLTSFCAVLVVVIFAFLGGYKLFI